MRAPDIKNGFIVNGVGSGANRWQTFVEAALIKKANGHENIAYLASDCRAEQISEHKIFGRRLSEVSAAVTWKGSIMLRSGAGIYHPVRRKISQELHNGPGQNAIVVAPNVEVDQIELGALLDCLQGPPHGRDNHIYMKVTWSPSDGLEYSIICPCRYLNHPDPVSTTGRYVQPISGYVLVEDGDAFHIAYVASYVPENGRTHTEICIREPISYFEVKAGIFGKLSYSIIKFLTAPFRELMLMDEFSRVIDIDATCEFFQYRN